MQIRYLYLFTLLLFFAGCDSDDSNADPVPDSGALQYLALGDSYTIGESVAEAERFPVQLVAALRAAGLEVADPTIIARTGWTTSDLLSAIATSNLQGKEYELVSLLIGVNNQFRGRSITEYKKEFTTLLVKAIDLAGDSKENVIVISIPDYGYTPYGRGQQAAISAEIDRFNAVNKRVADSIGVSYFYITPISRRGLAEPALVASDGLHPSGKMYQEWVELIKEQAKQKIETK